MIRISVLALLVSLFIAACSGTDGKKKYTIHVQVEADEGSKLLLQKRQQGDWVAVDSAWVRQGEAVFEGKIESPEIFFLSLEDLSGFFGFFAESAEINIELNTSNLRESDVVGSQTQDRFSTYTAGFEAFNDELRQHHRAYSQAEIEQNAEKMKDAELAFAETEQR